MRITPWGKSQSEEKLAPGLTWYSTPSHGGYYVSKELRDKHIPKVFQNIGYGADQGWFEEDCNWAIVCFFLYSVFPNAWKPKTYVIATQTLKRWFPKQWEEYVINGA